MSSEISKTELKGMIIIQNNWSLTVMVMTDGVKWRRELQVSQVP